MNNKEKTYLGITLDLTEREIDVKNVSIKPKTDFAELVLMGDAHVGSDGFSEHQFVSYINWIKKNPNVRVILMGDLLEVGDLSSFTPAQTEDLNKQLKRLVSLLSPIKDQIICMLEGNHEERYYRTVRAGTSLTRIIALELGIADKVLLPESQKGQLLVLQVADQYYPIYVIHGHTSAIFNKGTQLKRIAFTSKIPLIAHGHTHQIFHDHYVYRSVSKVKGKFYESIFEQHWISTGCFVKYLGYAEQASYPMTKIGAVILRFFSKKENVMVIDDARSFYGIGTEYPNELCNPPSIADNEVLEKEKKELGIMETVLQNPLKSNKQLKSESIKYDSHGSTLSPEGVNQDIKEKKKTLRI
jgi:predicted phosphodiesterase